MRLSIIVLLLCSVLFLAADVTGRGFRFSRFKVPKVTKYAHRRLDRVGKRVNTPNLIQPTKKYSGKSASAKNGGSEKHGIFNNPKDRQPDNSLLGQNKNTGEYKKQVTQMQTGNSQTGPAKEISGTLQSSSNSWYKKLFKTASSHLLDKQKRKYSDSFANPWFKELLNTVSSHLLNQEKPEDSGSHSNTWDKEVLNTAFSNFNQEKTEDSDGPANAGHKEVLMT